MGPRPRLFLFGLCQERMPRHFHLLPFWASRYLDSWGRLTTFSSALQLDFFFSFFLKKKEYTPVISRCHLFLLAVTLNLLDLFHHELVIL